MFLPLIAHSNVNDIDIAEVVRNKYKTYVKTQLLSACLIEKKKTGGNWINV